MFEMSGMSGMSRLETVLAALLLLAVLSSAGFVVVCVRRSRAALEDAYDEGDEDLREERARRRKAHQEAAAAFVRANAMQVELTKLGTKLRESDAGLVSERAKLTAEQARASRLEAELEAAKRARPGGRQHVGITYSSRNAGVADVMRALQQAMGRMQTEYCVAAHAEFTKQKNEVIALLRAMRSSGKPLKCANVTVLVKRSIDDLEASLRKDMSGDGAAGVVAHIRTIWTLVAAQICDANGLLDEAMLDAFMSAVFDAVCGIARS